MPDIKFTLNLTIEGSSLGEIDEGIMKAATQRLTARLSTAQTPYPTAQTPYPTPKEPLTANEMPAGLSLKINESIEQASVQSESASEIKEKKTPKKVKPKAEHTEVVPPEPKLITPPTKEEAVAALTSVVSKFGIDKGKEVLAHFGAKRLTELSPEKTVECIQYCEQLTQEVNPAS